MKDSAKALVCGLAAAAGLSGAVATAAPAAAATYNGACGTGYAVIDKMELPNDRGTIFLTYHSNGNNCVATVRTNSGTATLVEAYIRTSSSNTWIEDSGNYTTYAGPVYVSAPGQCVDWGGTIGTASDTAYDDHCG